MVCSERMTQVEKFFLSLVQIRHEIWILSNRQIIGTKFLVIGIVTITSLCSKTPVKITNPVPGWFLKTLESRRIWNPMHSLILWKIPFSNLLSRFNMRWINVKTINTRFLRRARLCNELSKIISRSSLAAFKNNLISKIIVVIINCDMIFTYYDYKI